MFIFLMIVIGSNYNTVEKCEHLNHRRISSDVSYIYSNIDLNPIYANRNLGDLKKYWKSTCASDRLEANKDIVRELSRLLSREQAISTVSSMMIDIGSNLSAARRDVDEAISLQTVREDARIRAASPIMPESGYALSYALKCIRVKIDTGRLDQNFCRYVPR